MAPGAPARGQRPPRAPPSRPAARTANGGNFARPTSASTASGAGAHRAPLRLSLLPTGRELSAEALPAVALAVAPSPANGDGAQPTRRRGPRRGPQPDAGGPEVALLQGAVVAWRVATAETDQPA